ncbi:MAG: hypothetical protein ACWGPR_08520 [Candidatus Deferrimicrobiaceae bacterium]
MALGFLVMAALVGAGAMWCSSNDAPPPAAMAPSICELVKDSVVFPTESGLEELRNAIAQDNARAIELAISANHGMVIRESTPCVILENGLLTVKVRIASGTFEGRAGYTPRQVAVR